MITQGVWGIASAIVVLWGTASEAVAQETTVSYTCQDVGGVAPEPLGDRTGHAITVSPYSCRIDTGPMSGGIDTGSGVWEWDGTNAVLLTLTSVQRKPGSTLVEQGTEGKLTLTMADGKVTGWTASGKCRLLLATGSAAPFANKPCTWTAKSTGPGQFAAEDKFE